MSKIKKLNAPDILRASSLIEASEKTMDAILQMDISDATSTIIFRETYESIRQLGDARWFLIGYKPKDHEASMSILKEESIESSAHLAKLDRFRSIRNDANYSGYMIPKEVTQEIIEFWKDCGEEILQKMKDEVK
jgi:uncharacterized protein (UPF0332 family)